MEVRKHLTGVFIGLMLAGCAGATFSYRYYGLSGVDYTNGTLTGPRPEDDEAFSKCAPSAQTGHPCVVMMQDQFFLLKQDYLDTQNKLSACEAKVANSE